MKPTNHESRTTNYETFMQTALALGRTGLGRTWPNPSVGCVIVKDGEIIVNTRTANSGRPHAETLALDVAGAKSQGATVYVTLEPCAHHGKTPPCAEALVKAGVAEVIIGCEDPDDRVSGKGIKILRDAGIKVTTGILEKECRDLNKGFFKRIEAKRPYIMLKAAISADGKYLTGNGSTRWLSGETARNEVQQLRSTYDAVLTGTGTILADNPQLNCRLAGLENCSPIKIVAGKRPIPGSANILRGNEAWFYGDAIEAINDLAERGITRLMIEAGPKLSNTLLAKNLVDEVIIFQSTQNLGENEKIFFAPDALNKFQKTFEQKFGADLKITHIRAVSPAHPPEFSNANARAFV